MAMPCCRGRLVGRIAGSTWTAQLAITIPNTNYVTAHNGFVWRFRKTGLLPKGGRRGIQVCLQFPGDDQVLLESPRPPDNFCPGPSRSGTAGPTDYLRISNKFYLEGGLLSCYKKVQAKNPKLGEG